MTYGHLTSTNVMYMKTHSMACAFELTAGVNSIKLR